MSCSIFDLADPFSPLTLDRVNYGHPLTSTCPIFHLPIELLSSITQHLDHGDLASLALVDRDCHQLARSIQFSTLKVDYYRPTTYCLLEKLKMEREMGTPTIGACVRCLIVTDMSNQGHQESIRDLAHQPWDLHHQSRKNTYISAVCAVIAGALPNLLALDWNVSVTLSSRFLQSIAVSPIKHLKLCGVSLAQTYLWEEAPPIGELQEPLAEWALETLDVTVVGKFLDCDSTLLDIVCYASPTLRVLALRSNIVSWKMSRTFGEKISSFPSLRALLLDSVGVDGDALAMLMGRSAQLRAIFIDSTREGISYNLRRMGYVDTLERFHWIRNHVNNHIEILGFIDANPHLRSFETGSALPASFICDRLLPRLKNFQDLTSLSLIWEGKCIPRDALRLLGFMVALRHVWLSAGDQIAHNHRWEIDHTVIRESLAPLRQLKSLAFSQDTYRMWWTRESSERYYTTKEVPLQGYFAYLNIEEIDEVEMLNDVVNDCGQDADYEGAESFLRRIRDFEDLAWERYHQWCMVELGTWYAECFPELEWCYMGQLSMVIRSSREADLEITERDRSLKVLKNKWGARTSTTRRQCW